MAVTIVVWTVLLWLQQAFADTHIGGPACRTNPHCGAGPEWWPPAAWLGGIVVILVLGFVSRRRDPGDRR